jgi:hypothetical protein
MASLVGKYRKNVRFATFAAPVISSMVVSS